MLAVAWTLGIACWPGHGDAGPEVPRAAIIDQLALTDPNPSLIEHARQVLAAGGFTVDYYPSDRVTVDMYRRLPARGYEIVIVRSHSWGTQANIDPATAAVSHVPVVSLFTTEVYAADRHVEDQRARRLNVVRIADSLGDASFDPAVELPDPPAVRYFGITPEFITHAAKGRFGGTTILLMGCDAVRSDGMVRALIGKGAGIVAGWDGPVTAHHTDDALAQVLKHLVTERRPPGEAVAAAMSDIGPDPAFGSKLIAFSED